MNNERFENRPEKDVLKEAVKYLIGVLENTPDYPNEDPDSVEKAREELKATFELFPVLIPRFVNTYKRTLEKIGLDMGKLSVYMVGGRAVGKPLKSSSDIDLIFAFEKPSSPFLKPGKIEIPEWIQERKKLVFEEFPKICEENGIKSINGHPGRFQFLSWAEKTPKDVEAGTQEGEKALLIFEE